MKNDEAGKALAEGFQGIDVLGIKKVNE